MNPTKIWFDLDCYYDISKLIIHCDGTFSIQIKVNTDEGGTIAHFNILEDITTVADLVPHFYFPSLKPDASTEEKLSLLRLANHPNLEHQLEAMKSFLKKHPYRDYVSYYDLK